ncbi:MAG: efflux RND transporter periplasmic adaptor subunit [Opitutaceae bacterium]
MILLFPRRRLAALFTTVVLSFIIAGCVKNAEEGGKNAGGAGRKSGKGGKGGGGAAPVLVGQVLRQRVPVVIDAIGAVEPIRMTAVRSQVTGTLEKIAFKEGKDVKQGDLLFQIDPRPFQGLLNSALADLQKAKVQLETARSQVARYQALSSGQMISKEQFQKIQDDARSAEAEMQAAESRVTSAKLQLEFSSIRAPLSGRTGNLNIDEGDLTRANDPGALVTINQVSPLYVTFGVPQQFLAAINRYQAQGSLVVRVIPPGLNEPPEIGELSFIDNTVDSATGTIRLKATFKNEQHRLWPGQFANVMVTLANPEVLTVAAAAIQNSQTGQHVYVISQDRIAELRPVTVERTHEGLAVVINGLKEGESVVIDGQLRVIPGRAVEIKQPAGTASSSAPVSKKAPENGKKKPDIKT